MTSPTPSWLISSTTEQNVDISWMTPQKRDVRAMFGSRPVAPPAPPPKVVPPSGPSPEQQKIIADAKEVIRLVAGSLSELSDATRREIGKIAEEIWNIATAVAEELAAGAIEADPNRTVALIIQSLELLGVDQDLKVHLNPKIHEQLRAQGLLEDLQAKGGITLIPDLKPQDVGVIIESPVGRVDARVHARIQQLRHQFAQKTGAAE
jgi:flagellar biosynthesis/type III secretory pathway protein FliH